MACINASYEHPISCNNVTLNASANDELTTVAPVSYHSVSGPFTIAIKVALTGILSSFGIVANIINLVVYLRMGLSHTTNINFFGMAFSDLLMQINALLTSIYTIPFVFKVRSLLNLYQVIPFVGFWLHSTTARTTGWITAFVSIERCLCVVLPLKVSIILSPQRTKVIICCIFIVSNLAMAPIYSFMRIRNFFSSRYNMTILYADFLPASVIGRTNSDVAVTFTNIVSPIVTFTIVSLCTVLLAIHLRRMSAKRQLMTAGKEGDRRQTKDQRMIKIVTAIAALYIIAYLPNIAMFLASLLINDMGSLFWVVDMYFSPFVILLEMFNSSVNIFIYFKMSTKYRKTFLELFCKAEK